MNLPSKTHFTGLEQSSSDWVQSILNSILNRKTQFKVAVFGSRATDKYRKYSDLDLWIETQPSLTTKEISDLYDLFDESDLPIKVDIVTPETCLPEYKQRILQELKWWYKS